MMKQIKDLKIILLVIVVFLVLVITRNSDPNIFKAEVKTTIDATNENLITYDQLKTRTSPSLIIDLRSENSEDSIRFENSVQIPFEKMLDKVNRKLFDDAKGDLILFSNNIATASKAWVILNQLGYKNLLILSSEKNPEELKYKFQPDTNARLEQDSI